MVNKDNLAALVYLAFVGIAGAVTVRELDLIPQEHKPRVVIFEGKNFQVPTEYKLRRVDYFIDQNVGTFEIYAPEEEADFVIGAYKARCFEESAKLGEDEGLTVNRRFRLWKEIVRAPEHFPVMDDGTVGYIARRYHFEKKR